MDVTCLIGVHAHHRVLCTQADYFAHAASDAWLSADEKAAAATAQRQREEAAARKRRELRVTLDFDAKRVVREGGAEDPMRCDERQ